MCLEGFLVSRKRQPYSLLKTEKRMTFMILLGSALFNTNQYFSNSTPPLYLELVYSLQRCFMLTCLGDVFRLARREVYCLGLGYSRPQEVTTHANKAVA